MGANAANALLFLVTTLFDIAMWVYLMRVLLQWSRADFYNPISQAIWKATRFPSDWLRPYLPNVRNINLAAVLTLCVIAVLYIYVVIGILGFSLSPLSITWYAALKLVAVTVNLYTFTIFIHAIMSWLGPGVNNPASNILWSLNEPLLRPMRRIIPPVSNLDLSPLVVILILQVFNRLLPLPGAFR